MDKVRIRRPSKYDERERFRPGRIVQRRIDRERSRVARSRGDPVD